MFRVATIFTLITACFVFSGCPKKGDKKDTKKAATKKADDKKADDKKADDKKADDKKADKKAGDVAVPENIKGVASCEAYWKAYTCYINKLPEAARAGAKKGMEATTAAWAKMPKGSKDALEKGCKMAVDGLKKAAEANAAMKKYWDGCLPK